MTNSLTQRASEAGWPAVAVVGGGYWGKNLIRNFASLGVLKCICDPADHARQSALQQYPGVRIVADCTCVLEDPTIQAVAVATPAETHAPLVGRLLQAGKDVFVEKPLALSWAEGEPLVETARRLQRILMVGHLLWYHPAVLKLKELVDSGQLGRIQYIYSNRLNLGRIRREENILWSFAPHDISVILGLLNEEPASVAAQGGYYLHEQIADVTVSLLSFPSGVRAHVFVSWLHPFKEQKLVVVGDRQMAVFDDLQPESKLLLYPHSVLWERQIPVASKADAVVVPVDAAEPLQLECRHFLDCVANRTKPRTDGHEGLRVLSVLERCQQAMDHSRTASDRSMTRSTSAPAYFVHESSYVDAGVQIGQGTKIWHFSHILSGSRLGKECSVGQNVVVGPDVSVGDHVKIQNNVSVYKGVTLEDHVFCGPSMVFTNVFNPRSEVPRMHELRTTLVRRGATLGANSTVVCGVTIGQYAFVGAGAVVTRDVPDFALVVGSPARIVGWMCQCGVKLTFTSGRATCTCGASYRQVADGRAIHADEE